MTAVKMAELVSLVLQVSPSERHAVLEQVIAFRASATFDQSVNVGRLRAAFAEPWEVRYKSAVPVSRMRVFMQLPIRHAIVRPLRKVSSASEAAEIEAAVNEVLAYLGREAAVPGSTTSAGEQP